MDMGDFNIDTTRGKIGEDLVYKLLKNGKDCIDVIDVRDYAYFRDIDVDFIQIKNNCEPLKIEVKTDMQAHKTGNIVYEFISSSRLNTLGCFEKTKSDFIFYYLFKSGHLYLINTPKLKEYVSENKDDFRIVRVGDDAKGYLLPITDLLEAKVCKRL